MSPASRLTSAGALVLSLISPAFAAGGVHGGHVAAMAPRMNGPAMARPAPRPPVAHAPVHRPAPHPVVQPVATHAVHRPAHAFAPMQRPHFQYPRHPALTLYNPRGKRLHGPWRRHARVVFLGATGAAYYSVPALAQPAQEYLPVEAPLTATYGEPQIIPAFDSCRRPAIHSVGQHRHAGHLPRIVYGVQPVCGPAYPAEPPADHGAAPARIRAAY